MNKLLKTFGMFATATLLTLAASNANATDANELKVDSDQAIKTLIQKNSLASEVAKKAKAVLIFPNIVKAGLVFGGAYGEGVLEKNGVVDSYYNSVSASFGWQAGAQSYGYAVFLMNDKAIDYLKDSKGWEFGVGPTVVMVDEGVAKNLSTTTLQKDAYAFTFNQQGLMASLSLEGTKVSKIDRP